jgi:mercuric ion binding protein
MRKLAILLVVSLLSGCLSSAAQEEERSLPQSENLRQATLEISGMTCPACPTTIETNLLPLEGVLKVDISLERQGGIVVYDPGKITAEEIVKADIFSWGVYSAEVVEDIPFGREAAP